MNNNDIFPTFLTSSLIKGNCLHCRINGVEYQVSAPKKMLIQLFEWCQGQHSITDIEILAKKKWGDNTFVPFVQDLMDAGIVVNYRSLFAISSKLLIGRSHLQAGSIVFNPNKETNNPLNEKNRRILHTLNNDRLSRLITAFSTRNNELANCLRPQYSFVVFRETDGIAPAIYHLQGSDTPNSLELFSKDIFSILPSVQDPRTLTEAEIIVCLTTDIAQLEQRFGNRALALALHNAGEITERTRLLCPELGWKLDTILEFEAPCWETALGLGINSHILSLLKLIPNNQAKNRFSGDFQFEWSTAIPSTHIHLARVSRSYAHKCEPISGWGYDPRPELAYDKAVAEFVERWGFHHPGELVTGTARELKNCILPDTIIRYSSDQYRSKSFPFRPFQQDHGYKWAIAKELLNGKEKLILADCLYHESALKSETDFTPPFTRATSSGCAAGPHQDSAIQSGILELCERDAFMRHWLSQSPGIGVRADSLPQFAQNIIQELCERGCQIHVQILNRGIIPVWMVYALNHAKHFSVISAGCHYLAERGLKSALYEAYLGCLLRLDGPQAHPGKLNRVRTPQDHIDLYATKRYYLKANALSHIEQNKCINFESAAALHRASFDQVLSKIVEAGYTPYWLPLHCPDIAQPHGIACRGPVSAVRVVIPGLIPITFGYGQMPLGMDLWHHSAARFPHPFP